MCASLRLPRARKSSLPGSGPFRSARNEERTRWIRAVDDAAAPTRNSATGPCPLRSPSPAATLAQAPGDGLCRITCYVQLRTVSGWRQRVPEERPLPRVTCAVWPWAVAAHSCPKWQPFVLRSRVELSRQTLVLSASPFSNVGARTSALEISRTCSCSCSPTPCPGQIGGSLLVHSAGSGRNFRILGMVLRAKCEGPTMSRSGHGGSLRLLAWEICGACSAW